MVESNGRSHGAVRFTVAGTSGAFAEVDVFETERACEDVLVALLSLGEDVEAGAEHGVVRPGERDRHGALAPYGAVVLVGHSLRSVIAFVLVDPGTTRTRTRTRTRRSTTCSAVRAAERSGAPRR